MEISSEILFEEHAVVYEYAVNEIAVDMNIALDSVELVHRDRLGARMYHLLNYRANNGKTGGVLISEDEVANIPNWPLPQSIIDGIKSSLESKLL
jgi:hypothetical protein